ncbi:MAG: CsgG/HfaB family protein [Gemmatimonadaceae bacterium]
MQRHSAAPDSISRGRDPRRRVARRAMLLAGVATVLAGPLQAQKSGDALRIPAGWSDSYFAKLDRSATPTVNVAVMEFSGGQLVEDRLRFRMSDILITELVKAGRFGVVERDRLDVVLSEQKLQKEGLTDVSNTALRLGKLINAELVVFGLVTSATHQKVDRFAYDLMRSEVSVDIRAVDAGTGQVVISETAQGVAEAKVVTTAKGEVVSGRTDYDALDVDAARNALERVAQRLAEAFPLVGLVVQADGDAVFLDAGAARGVKTGDSFVVFRKGREITHPTTKEHLGWEKVVVGSVQVTGADARLATARVVRLASDGVPIAAGDVAVAQSAPAGGGGGR